MKKIERSIIYPEKTHCIVKESDLDELEQQRDEAVELLQFCYDNIENIYTVESAITNYIQKAGKHE